MPGFHNPYGFVPAPARTAASVWRDGPPSPLGTLDDTNWSGRLRLRLTATTPLLITEQSGNDPVHRRTRTVGDEVSLPPTSVKGMIRAEYEMVTNSRFGVFDPHDERLGHRIRSGQPRAADLVPVRLFRPNGDLAALPLRGDPGSRRVMGTGALPAAWVPRYGGQVVQLAPGVEHGKLVYGWVVLMRRDEFDRNRNEWVEKFLYWRVLSMQTGRHAAPTVDHGRHESSSSRKRHVLVDAHPREVRGFYVETGHNIDNKHDERLFFTPELLVGPRPPKPLELNEKVPGDWAMLMRSYWNAVDPPGLAAGLEPSRHLRPEARNTLVGLPDATFCYATVEGGRVTQLYPVAMSRRLYELTPRDLAKSARLTPAETRAELSPADRLFGWAPTTGRDTARAETRALRGRVRLGAVETKKADVVAVDKSLAILGQPRPTQDLFYGAADDQGRPLRASPGYRERQGLRGRKVYPHQPRNRPRVAGGPALRPWLLHGTGDETTSQSAKLVDMVEEGAVFETDLHIENVTARELGALLYVLQGSDVGGPKQRHHKLGGGKPLGFGSVTVEVLLDASDVRDTAAWRAYLSLADDADGRALDAIAAQELAGAAAGSFGARERRAYDAYLEGFAEDAEVHYPEDPNNRGSDEERFKWFVDNRKKGAGHALGELGGDPLPASPTSPMPRTGPRR